MSLNMNGYRVFRACISGDSFWAESHHVARMASGSRFVIQFCQWMCAIARFRSEEAMPPVWSLRWHGCSHRWYFLMQCRSDRGWLALCGNQAQLLNFPRDMNAIPLCKGLSGRRQYGEDLPGFRRQRVLNAISEVSSVGHLSRYRCL